jgi:hypothetical protein
MKGGRMGGRWWKEGGREGGREGRRGNVPVVDKKREAVLVERVASEGLDVEGVVGPARVDFRGLD